MESDEKSFKVVDRRRFVNYDPMQPAEGNYALPKGTVSDECDEAFRIASFGGPDESPPETVVPEKYEPVVAPTGSDIQNVSYQAGDSGSRFRGLYIATAVVAGLGLLFLLGGCTNNTSRNYKPPRSSVTQTQAEPIYNPSRPEVDLTSFREYRKMRDAEVVEIRNGIPAQFNNEIPIPPEIQTGENNPAYIPKAFAVDLNEDGIDEVILQEGCGSNECWGKVYQKTDSGYAVIVDKYVDILSKEKTSGYRNVYSGNKVYLPGGGFSNPFTKYVWNGQTYVKSGVVSNPVNMSDVANSLRMFFKTGSSSDVQKSLQELEKSLGTDNILGAMLLSQMAPNIPLPEGDELDRFLIQLSEDQGINYRDYVNNPEGLRRVMFGSMTNNIMINPTSPGQLVFAGGVSIAKSLAKELGMDPRSQYIKTLRKVDSRLDDYINRTGHVPNDQRLADMLQQGATFAIREDELRTIQNPDTSDYGRSSSPSGTIERRTFDPSQVPGDHRYLNTQPRVDERQQRRERAQQMDQATRQQLQQGADATRKAIEKILPPPKKPPGK